jgi:hypothetical protein
VTGEDAAAAGGGWWLCGNGKVTTLVEVVTMIAEGVATTIAEGVATMTAEGVATTIATRATGANARTVAIAGLGNA